MKKYEGYMICTDLDGTMLNAEHVISEENKRAVLHFMEEGGIFTVATGRTPIAITPIFNEFLPNAPIVTHNGAAVYDLANDSYLAVEGLDNEAIEVMEYVERNFGSSGFEVYDHSDIYCYKPNKSVEWHLNIENIPLVEKDYRDIPMPWTKAMFVQTEEQTNILREHMIATDFADRYSFIRSSRFFLECVSKNASKGSAMLKIKSMLPKPIHTAIGVGDNENDISLLKAADISYAVENAIDELKRVAMRITVRNREHAIARIIEEI